ncbi:multicopper oxidase-domain-containing protein [Xylaria cubensis]|nr:multicopper oxidase-domain-containing protein [Xylaria cubensis]
MGVTRYYNFTVSRGSQSPDGVSKTMLLVNGQFPGPLIEAQWGDTIEGRVHNAIDNPKEAEEYGTSWCHAHYSGQYMDGAFGPMIFHGSPANLKIRQIIFTPNNNLINGKIPFDCSISHDTICVNDASRSVFKLINAGNSGIQKFSIDNHDLLVVTNDFFPVKPYKTKVVTLGVGQRSDVLVTAGGMPTDAVWMRSELNIECLNVTSIQLNATAAVYYPKANTNSFHRLEELHDPLSQTIPLYPKTPGRPDITMSISLTVGLNGTGNVVFYVNNSSFYGKYERSFSAQPESNVINLGSATSVRLMGFGEWDGVITNPLNPQRRDSQQLGPGTTDEPAFIVIQWETDNPGIWPFHCHISTHASAGLYVNILQQPNLVTDKQIPEIVRETCDPWNSYAKSNDVHQFDSGLKFCTDVK